MPSHSMNRPAPIAVFSAQRRTKSTIWSRTSCATQIPIRSPQDFFLTRRAPPSARPIPRLWSGSSWSGTRCDPAPADGWCATSSGRLPPRSRRTPSATGREPSAGGPVHRTASRSAPGPANVASEWLPSLRLSSVSSSFSCVLSVILTAERSLHFQLRQNSTGKGLYYVRYFQDFAAFQEDNIWGDTGIAGFASEKRYVVETSEKVIQRCLLMVTDPGDLVLDPTCGSGTTAYVA